MLGLLIGLVVICLVVYLAWYALSRIPMPPPVRVVATVLFLLICILLLVNYLPVASLDFRR